MGTTVARLAAVIAGAGMEAADPVSMRCCTLSYFLKGMSFFKNLFGKKIRNNQSSRHHSSSPPSGTTLGTIASAFFAVDAAVSIEPNYGLLTVSRRSYQESTNPTHEEWVPFRADRAA
jgi:hypothetical protein